MSSQSNIKTRSKQGHCGYYSDLDKHNLRQKLKRELAKEPIESEYDPEEYEPHCEACAKGTCPMYDEFGNQVGVNGDYGV